MSGAAWLDQLEQQVSTSTSQAGKPRDQLHPAEAETYYVAALRADSWLWEAWTGWCRVTDASEPPRPPSVFSTTGMQDLRLPDGLLPAQLTQRLRTASRQAVSTAFDSETSRAFSPSAQTNSSEASTSARSYRKLSPLPQNRQHIYAQTPAQGQSAQNLPAQPSRSATELAFAAFSTAPQADFLKGRPGLRPDFVGSPSGSPFQPTATSTPTVGPSIGNALDASRSSPAMLVPGYAVPQLGERLEQPVLSRSSAQKRARRPDSTGDAMPARNGLQTIRSEAGLGLNLKRRIAGSKNLDTSGRPDRMPEPPVRRSSRLQAVYSDAVPVSVRKVRSLARD